MRPFSESTIRLWFRISLAFKAIISVIEIIGGAVAYFVSPHYLMTLVTMLTREELIEDPRNFIARHLVESASHISLSSQHFVALYLLSHGIIKIYLIVGLLREKLWYYPLALVTFMLFVAYQIYRFQITHSMWLLAITVVDVVVIALTWHEFRYLRRQSRSRTTCASEP